jgi:hypothetical protein
MVPLFARGATPQEASPPKQGPVFGPALPLSASLRPMDPIDEEADLRADLVALDPGALADLRRLLEGSREYGNTVLVAFIARPANTDLATLIAMADTDELVRLRLLRAMRNLGPNRWDGPAAVPRTTTKRSAEPHHCPLAVLRGSSARRVVLKYRAFWTGRGRSGKDVR